MKHCYLIPASTLAWLGAALLVPTAAFAGPVGFAVVSVPDGANPPLEVGIWYPTATPPQPTRLGLYTQNVAAGAPIAGEHLPLVVLSHGNGGALASHYDTALALAEAGFVVAAPTHAGDTYGDQSHATDLPGRVRQLSQVIDYMVADWPAKAVDPSRVGAFGFSAGGFTVLAAAGGNADFTRIAPHCAAYPSYFECKIMATHAAKGAVVATNAVFVHNTHIRAIAVAAPALGYTFSQEGLAALDMPVQLWRAEDDEILPHPFSAEAVRLALPKPPEMHVVAHAGHFDFLAPCSDALANFAPLICMSEPGFDRAAFHRSLDGEVVGFFQRALGVSE